MNNMQNHPIETVEQDSGVIVRRYDVRADAGGPGKWRGGAAQVITVEVLRDGGVLLARGMERLRFPSFGVGGGGPGRAVRVILNEGRADERELTKIDQLPVDKGDTLTIMMPGGGGYGDPFERDTDRVLADVDQGFVSREGAERDYGVVITDAGRVEHDATTARRRARVRANVGADFDCGSERAAWETVFDDPTMMDLNRRLMELPVSVRQDVRRRIIEKAVPDIPVAGGGRTLASVMGEPDAIRARLAEAMAEAFDAADSAAE